MVVALDNGDVLKCNFQNILDENENLVSDNKNPKGQTTQNHPTTKSQNPKNQSNVNRDKNAQGQSAQGQSENEASKGETEGEDQGDQEESGDVVEIESTKIYNPLLVPNVSILLLYDF